MIEGQTRSSISQIVQEMPGFALASIGFGSFLLSTEGYRLSAFQTVNSTDQFQLAASIASLVVLIVLTLFYAKRAKPLHSRTFFIVVIGAIMSVTMFITLRQGVWENSSLIFFLGRTLFNLLEGIVFFLWMQTLFPYGARKVAVVFAASTIVLAALSCLIAFLKTEAAYSAVSMLPIISVGCLCYFREYAKTHAQLPEKDNASQKVSPPEQDSCVHPDKSLFMSSDKTPAGKWFFPITLMASLSCYAIIFGHIHYHWLPLQDGASLSLIIQLGTALGTACGGLLILVLVRFFWNRRSLEFYKIFLIPTIILALWLSSYTDETWIFFYLVLLNIAQKLAFLFIILAPFLIKSKPPYLLPWCIAYLSFAFGKTLSALLLGNMSQDVLVSSSVVVLVILFISSAITSLSSSTNEESISNDKSADPQHLEPFQGDNSLMHSHKLQKACEFLSEKYSLTNREKEILLLLARGRTSQHIADVLVVTQSTAKTHLRNIYAKMGIHNQQELINLVELTIDEQKALEVPNPA